VLTRWVTLSLICNECGVCRARVCELTLRGTANLDFDDLQSKQKYSRYTAYSRSKLAQVLHANKLQRRLEGISITLHRRAC
jgi:hypothetical protein